MGEDPPYQI